MSQVDRGRQVAAWSVSLALAAVAGAVAVWTSAPAPPAEGFVRLAWAAAAASMAAAIAVAVAALRTPRAAAGVDGTTSAAASPNPTGRRPAVHEGSHAESATADTRPAIWADTGDPGSAPDAAATRPSRSAGLRAAFDHQGAIDSERSAAAEPTDRAASEAGDATTDAASSDAGADLHASKAGAEATTGETRRETLQDALRQALAAGELRLVYQPIFDLEARHVQAIEALLRWPRASQALMPTADIVALADRAGIGPALGRFVLAGAAHQLVRWQQVLGNAAPNRVSVNLSRGQCLSETLLDDLDEAMRSNGLTPEAFQFEVAERDVVSDAGVESRLHELRALGASVALDRFGEADSSLAGLMRLPVDLVKIDHRLVHRAEHDPNVRMVLESTLGLAARMGMDVVSEGVETTSQLAMVRSLGCRLAQGNALCPPTDAFALTRRLRGGHWLAAASPGASPSSVSGNA